jgi:hypothetical protein
LDVKANKNYLLRAKNYLTTDEREASVGRRHVKINSEVSKKNLYFYIQLEYRAADLGSILIRIHLNCWIQIQIRIYTVDLNLNTGVKTKISLLLKKTDFSRRRALRKPS